MAMTLLTTNTESGDATSSFTSSIDSTYKLYIFKFYDANPATDTQELVWQGSIDGGSNYNVAITSNSFESYHGEDGSGETVVYTTVGIWRRVLVFKDSSEMLVMVLMKVE